ncbi:hypothetical protein [Leptolyngbya sp. 7M]|uniref:hypothetical protein n=1 Tax=Leptolyngbya sp. 7M TaxID=2812896 RepID=UPI001B8C6C89|nr:hypothetical protein [Leptolyngbya sp. 7M]QYO65235.1 hypothetical protein JVX88_00165 [Leptolyngbya sp. 7M]
MNIRVGIAKVFAVLSLIFLVSLSASGSLDDPYYVLKAGTRIKLRLDTPVNSAFSSRGDTFKAHVARPVERDDRVVLQEGVELEGRVVFVQQNSAVGRAGRLELDFGTLRFANGETRVIDARLARPLKSASKTGWQLASVIGGTLAGTILGVASGNERGAAIGAGIGAAAGTGVAVAIKGDNVGIASGQEFEIILERDVTLPFREV